MTAVTVYDFEAITVDHSPFPLDRLRGKVLLIVNVASRCGYTPQYRALEALYRKHRESGFVVLGFPCDQFGHQEPGDDAQIRAFCSKEYDVTFPLFSKIQVNGHQAHPLYVFLRAQRAGWLGMRRIAWNFTKFLVGRRGQVLSRHGPRVVPATIEPDILRALAAGEGQNA